MPQASVLEGFKELAKVPQLPALFGVTFLLQFAMISPMSLLPIYVEKLHGSAVNIAFWAGMVSAVTGISNMLASPLLGKLSDKVGAHRILTYALIGAALFLIPQAFVTSVWQLIVVRFLMGVFMGGLLPSVNALIRSYTPDGKESRAFGFNSSTLAPRQYAGGGNRRVFVRLYRYRGLIHHLRRVSADQYRLGTLQAVQADPAPAVPLMVRRMLISPSPAPVRHKPAAGC